MSYTRFLGINYLNRLLVILVILSIIISLCESRGCSSCKKCGHKDKRKHHHPQDEDDTQPEAHGSGGCSGGSSKPKGRSVSKPKGRSSSHSSKPKSRGRSMGKPQELDISDMSPEALAIYKAFNVTLGSKLDEDDARKMVNDIEPWINAIGYYRTKAEWDYVTNITTENEKKTTKAALDFTKFHRNKYWPVFVKFNWTSFKDVKLKRHFKFEALLGLSALSIERLEKFTELKNNMVKIYSTAKVCNFTERKQCDIALDPGLNSLFASSRNPEELQYYWTEWRKMTGKKMPEMYKDYVKISNEGARLNGFYDMGEFWRRPYDEPLMALDHWAIWGELRPLYETLHAYVRRRLINKYGDKLVSSKGTIGAHLLGNIWAQNWGNIYDLLAPFNGSGVANMDVTPAMIAANYTVLTMFQKADEFFQSLGLLPLEPSFWNGSILERPPAPRQIVCHPEAWDLSNGKDYWIKMCTEVTMRDFVVVHHELGHIQYYMQYKGLLNTLRDGANPGFHEAIGDTISMSVGSPGHLQSIGLLEKYEDNKENRINFLLMQALKLLVDLPWDIVLEQWRWDVFNGKIKPEQYNCHWWKLRSHFQGVHPPATRSWKDFDPGSKYHIPNSTPYDRYFVARILTYQLHEALCKVAGQYKESDPKPLFMCSIHGSKEAGKKLEEMLKLGASVPWPEALEKVTGKRRLDAKPVINYYAPLIQWLEEENRKNGDEPGWEEKPMEELCVPKEPYI